MECIFCKIINKEINSYSLYEDDLVKVILDVNPKHNGHLLILPKKHYVDISDIDMDTLSHIMKISKDMYKLLNEKLKPDGISLIQNNGIAQEIKHFHLHLIPKYKKEIPMDLENIYNKLK